MGTIGMFLKSIHGNEIFSFSKGYIYKVHVDDFKEFYLRYLDWCNSSDNILRSRVEFDAFKNYFKKGYYFEMTENSISLNQTVKLLENEKKDYINEYNSKEKIRKSAEKVYNYVTSTISAKKCIDFIENYGIEMYKLGKNKTK